MVFVVERSGAFSLHIAPATFKANHSLNGIIQPVYHHVLICASAGALMPAWIKIGLHSLKGSCIGFQS